MILERLLQNVWVVGGGALILVAGVYVGSVYALHRVTGYFLGWEIADRVACKYGLPYLLFRDATSAIWRRLTWPWRQRRRRLLIETFNVELASNLSWENREEAQRKVDAGLRRRARDLRIAFDKQEDARRRPQNKAALDSANREAKWRKKVFWRAHGIAKRGGYYVKRRYRNYL